MKAIEIKGLTVEFVSYVTSPANKKKFFLVKSEDASPEPNVEKQVKILVNKDVSDNEPHLIYGIVYSPGEIDAQGNFMTEKEIQKSQHGFLKNYRLIDEQHNKIPGAGEVVECYCSLADMEISGETITKGSWILVTEPDDEAWQEIQKGTYTGYSLYGFAEELIESEVRKANIWDKLKELFNIKKDFNTQLQNYENNDIWHLFYIFEDAVMEAGWKAENGEQFKTDILKNIKQLSTKIKEMTFETIEKENKAKTQDGEPVSEKVNKNKGVQMDDKLKEEITEMLKPQFDEILTSIASIQKSIEKVEPEPEPEPEPAEDKDNPLDELKKGFEEIKNRLTTAEEAILGSKSTISDTEDVEVVKPGIKTNII